MSAAHTFLTILLLYSSRIYAWDEVGQLWNTPSLPDFNNTFINGETYTISWNVDLYQAFYYYASNAIVTDLDLWCSDFEKHLLWVQVASQVNINESTTLLWRVNMSSADLENTNSWVFRFLAHGLSIEDVDINNETVSSPGFYINETTGSSTSQSVASSLVPSTTSIQYLSSTAAATSVTATATPSTIATSHSSSGLSTGATAGIGVGAALGGLVLIVLGFFAARKHQSKSHKRTSPKVVANGHQPVNETKPPQENGKHSHVTAPEYTPLSELEPLQSHKNVNELPS